MTTYGIHNYFVYILTNKNKQVLYIGVTNDLQRRLFEHNENKTERKGFTGKYNCSYLVYWERYQQVQDAIDRETEIKKWRREKKFALINAFNPSWRFLNEEIFD